MTNPRKVQTRQIGEKHTFYYIGESGRGTANSLMDETASENGREAEDTARTKDGRHLFLFG